MANIVVLGAGVMGSALANVAAVNNEVTLVGSPLDNGIIEQIKNGKPHPDLRVNLNERIVATASNELTDATMKIAEVIVLGVSSPGVDWAVELLKRTNASPNILALVTKGLVSAKSHQLAPSTYAQTIDAQLTRPAGRIVGIGGPCIARELALAYPTRVCFASEDITVANKLRELMKTDYYFIATHNDFSGLEACAALKNFMCIGVSAMFTSFKLDDSHAKNPLAALFNQAVQENQLSTDIGQDLAFDLAGLGDLHVTVGGGRNSRLGQYLGTGRVLSDILQTDMHKVTVEGVDTGRALLPGFRHACSAGKLNADALPLSNAIFNVIENDLPFSFDFSNLPR